MGDTPYNFLPSCDLFPPIRYMAHLPKTRCTIILSLILHCPAMQTLEQLVLLTVPFLFLLDLHKQVWHLPLKLAFWETILRRCSTQTLTSLSKTLPWDYPVARALDFEVHRRKMAGNLWPFLLCVGLFIPLSPFSRFYSA